MHLSLLQEQVVRKKRKCIPFFNSADGKRLRLQSLHHHTVAVKKMAWCTLCRLLRGKEVGPRSLYRYTACGMKLCLQKSIRESNSCLEEWHSGRFWCTVRNVLSMRRHRRTRDSRKRNNNRRRIHSRCTTMLGMSNAKITFHRMAITDFFFGNG